MLHDWTTLKKLVWLNCRNGEKTLGPASIVSFIGRASSEITALTADITPVQSFNGYDHPWPGGGGKNLLDVSTCTLGKYIGENGSIGTLEAAMYSALIPVVIGDSYTYSYNLTGTGSNTRIHGYDENGNWLQQIATGSNAGQITISFAIPDGVRYVRISTTKPGWTGAKDHQFEKSSTKTAYAPYENICPITGFTGANLYVSPTKNQADATIYTEDWTSVAGTIYKGSFDSVLGTLTKTQRSFDYQGIASTSVTSISVLGEMTRFWLYDVNALGNGNMLCNMAPVVDSKYYASDEIGVTYMSAYPNSIAVKLPKSLVGTTVDSIKSFLQTGAFQMVQDLIAPVEYTLTPQTVTALLGQNYVWADTGDVTVTVKL